MSEKYQKTKDKPITAERIYEQPSDAISFYSEIGQVFATKNEVVLQFYETIPGPPGPKGSITTARSRLKATVTLSLKHAANIGKLLVQKTKEKQK